MNNVLKVALVIFLISCSGGLRLVDFIADWQGSSPEIEQELVHIYRVTPTREPGEALILFRKEDGPNLKEEFHTCLGPANRWTGVKRFDWVVLVRLAEYGCRPLQR